MRTIEFRGKAKSSKQWLYGYLVCVKDEMYIFTNPCYDSADNYEVLPETVGQFTGLTDKNGNKIFEGDVVKQRYYPLGANPKAVEYYNLLLVMHNGYVMYKKEGLKILDKSLAGSHHREEEKIYKHPTAGIDWITTERSLYKYEIIGNIHDNPELTK